MGSMLRGIFPVAPVVALCLAIQPMASAASLRDTYLDGARKTLQSATGTRTKLWAWLDAHPAIRTGLLTADSPPNPDHAANLDDLLAAVTPAQAERFSNLLLALSLQPRFGGAKPETPPADPNVAPLARAMKERNLALAEVIARADELAGELKLTLPAANKRGVLWNQLAQASGTYPAREAQTAVKWAKWLIAHQEMKLPPFEKGPNWPLFPVDRTPWPLLLPLAQELPQNEAEFIWDRFTGKIPDAGGQRVRTYASYSWDYEKPEVKFKKSPWEPNSVPRILEDGGVCGRLSTLGQYTLVALGQPALGMYQPGHRAMLSYEFNAANQQWSAKPQQSITGPQRSTNQWFLPSSEETLRMNVRDNGTAVSGIEFHSGLALSMNLGIDRWTDGRIGLASARKADKPAEAIRLLQASATRSPYDPEIWYELAGRLKNDPKAVNALLAKLDELAAPEAVVENKTEERGADTDFNRVKETAVAKDQRKESTAYASLVAHFIFTSTYEKNYDNTAGRNVALRLMREEITRRETRKTPYGPEVQPLVMRYRCAVQGLAVVGKELDAKIATSLADKKKPAKKLEGVLPELQAVADALEPKERITWLETLREKIPAALRYTNGSKGVAADATYGWITGELVKTLKRGDASARERAKALSEELDKEKNAVASR